MAHLPEHSEYGASSAVRWRKCWGSQVLAKGMPDTSSAAATEGTALHALLEQCLIRGESADQFADLHYDDHGEAKYIVFNEEQQESVNRVLDMAYAIGGKIIPEMRIFYGEPLGLPNEIAFGTSDITIMVGTVVHVIDAKFGRGMVEAIENDQMLLYAIGTVDSLEFMGEEVTEIHMYIGQPRTHNTTKPWVISRDELTERTAAIKADAHQVEKAKAEYELINTVEDLDEWTEEFIHPGESQCQWCRAKVVCTKFGKIFDSTLAMAEASKVTDFNDMDADIRTKALENEELVLAFLKACRESVQRDLLAGTPVTGFKMVTGSPGNRAWKQSDDLVLKTLVEEYGSIVASPSSFQTEPSLASVAAVEKIIKKGIKDTNPSLKRKDLKPIEEAALVALGELVVRPAGKPTLAKADDERRDWVPETCVDEFENLTE